MPIASITQYLADPNKSFQRGRMLYEQYGDNRIVMALIKSGSGSYHFTKLLEGLKEVNRQMNLEPKPIVIADHIQKPAGKTAPDFTSAPDKIIEIKNAKTANYAKARKLFEVIRLTDGRQNRLNMGLELLDLMDKVNDAWSVIDEWKDKGKVREQQLEETEKSVSELTIAELMKEAKNLPTYISKDRTRLKDAATDAKKVKISTRLEINIKRLELVKQLLEGIG